MEYQPSENVELGPVVQDDPAAIAACQAERDEAGRDNYEEYLHFEGSPQEQFEYYNDVPDQMEAAEWFSKNMIAVDQALSFLKPTTEAEINSFYELLLAQFKYNQKHG